MVSWNPSVNLHLVVESQYPQCAAALLWQVAVCALQDRGWEVMVVDVEGFLPPEVLATDMFQRVARTAEEARDVLQSVRLTILERQQMLNDESGLDYRDLQSKSLPRILLMDTSNDDISYDEGDVLTSSGAGLVGVHVAIVSTGLLTFHPMRQSAVLVVKHDFAVITRFGWDGDTGIVDRTELEQIAEREFSESSTYWRLFGDFTVMSNDECQQFRPYQHPFSAMWQIWDIVRRLRFGEITAGDLIEANPWLHHQITIPKE